MPEIALVVLGLFVLVWIISAVVKASQNGGSKQPGPSPARQRPAPSDSPRVERTSNSDIDRFMAEIDRLRRRGEGAPAGRAPEPPRPAPRQAPRPAPRPVESAPKPGRLAERENERDRERERKERDRDREREQRPRPSARSSPPPPLPRPESVPVLRPIAPDLPAPPPPPPAKPAKPARPVRTAAAAAAATGVLAAPPSPILVTLQSVLKSKQGPAAALILAEILGEPPGRRGTVRPPHRPKHG